MNTILLFAVLLFGTFLRGADAASVSYTGAVTTDSPKWTRPDGCGCFPPPPACIRNVGYTFQSFNVLITGLFTVMISVDSSQVDFDGVIFVYQNDFDPNLPDENLLDCNDDATTSERDSFVTVSLQCGTQYFVVTTAFAVVLPQFGNFTNTISGHAGGMPVLGPLDESDTDGDGVTDVCDNCPMDDNASQEDLDGDGMGNVCDPDIDNDGVDNGIDNCPMDVNASQEDLDGDGIGNVCDNCPMDVNASQEDLDGDGIGNVCDNCPMDVNLDRRLMFVDSPQVEVSNLRLECDRCASLPDRKNFT